MKKLAFGLILGVAAGAACVLLLANHASKKLRYHTLVGPVYVGQMTPDQAKTTLNRWWEKERNRPITLKSQVLEKPIIVTPAQLNIGVDTTASLAEAPRASILDSFRKPKTSKLAPAFTIDGSRLAALDDQLNDSVKAPGRAKVFYEAGQFRSIPESGHAEVDRKKLQSLLMAALAGHSTLQVPFIEAPKRITDSDIASIHEVVSEFTTHFNTAKKSRCSNIRLASSKLNGVVLMPGEHVSFNDTVGRRTQEGGFQIAGVYKNGKHDFDVGGGICQVSTTLYNAALFADLKIVHRHNHTMPVPYVPLGRDATVDYGALDLELANNTGHPIAINSEYHPGKLTFRVLGTKDPGLDVKIESTGRTRWDAGMQLVVDPTLPPGKKKVVDKGVSGQQIATFREVYRDGKLVRRESLGSSYYKGGQRIIAVGPKQSTVSAPSGAMKLVSADSH